VYDEIEKPEATAFEQDRFLVYQSCLGCHPHDRPSLLQGYRKMNWTESLTKDPHPKAIEELELSQEQVDRIVTYLEEHVR
jgi:hypothetical protein